MTNEVYLQYVRKKERERSSPLARNTALAFIVGGAICVLGQLLSGLYLSAGMSESDAGTAVTVTLIFLSALFTGLGLYDRLAKHAGAGTLVPVTGFANAVVSPAIDFKSEGFITGMAAKMFLIAGPVIVYGTVAGVVYGIVLVLLGTA